MGRYNEELVDAGVLLVAEGLHQTSKGARVRFVDGKHTVIDGPFTESNPRAAHLNCVGPATRRSSAHDLLAI